MTHTTKGGFQVNVDRGIAYELVVVAKNPIGPDLDIPIRFEINSFKVFPALRGNNCASFSKVHPNFIIEKKAKCV